MTTTHTFEKLYVPPLPNHSQECLVAILYWLLVGVKLQEFRGYEQEEGYSLYYQFDVVIE